MADKNKKDATPPPLLLMPASEGLTLNPSGGPNVLMPVPQVDASLFQPEDGEADSFLGQSPPKQAPMPFFQSPPSSSTPDPFAQLGQPTHTGHSGMPPPVSQSFPGVDRQGSPSPPHSISPQPPGQGAGAPVSSMMHTMPEQHSSGSQYRMSQAGKRRPQYAPPPPGTYAQDGSIASHPHHPSMSGGAPPSGFPPAPTQYAPPPTSQFSPTMTSVPPSSYASPHSSPPNISPPGLTPGPQYIPIHHHWFFCKNVELRQIWQPFSIVDSVRLEEAFRAGVHDNLTVSTDGGRYDVDISERNRTPVYWDEAPNKVRRCSWFYRPEGDNRFVPYEEDFAQKLEAEYKNAIMNDEWHKRLEFGGGETIVMHNPNVIVHFRPSSQPDEWGTTQGEQVRPRVVKRGVDEFDEIADGEPSQIDHVVFIVHGIGPTCDLRFRNIIECVDDFRNVSLQMVGSHFSTYSEEGRIGRVEFLPVRWHSALHNDATGVDRRLKAITLNSIGKLRHFTNDTLLDILFYASPTYAQNIADTVGEEINRLFRLFSSRNPEFRGGVSISGHSLGSLILFDLLVHQRDPSAPAEPEPEPAPQDTTPTISRENTPAKEFQQTNGDVADGIETLEELLAKLGLTDFKETFQREQIDMESLTMIEESDIKEMGLPMGPRKKLQAYIREKKKKEDAAEVSRLRQQEAENRLLEEQRQATSQTQPPTHAALHDPLLRSASNTSVNYVGGVSGTGTPFVKYPQLDFCPVNFFALGSPVAMFLTVRGVDKLGDEFRLPTCQGFFNIFHPFDPVAYRLEPLLVSSYPAKPVLMPHHKGRKRFHLELKESLTRVGADLKQKIVDSLKSTWKTINDFALAHRSTAQEVVDNEMDSVISQMTQEQQDKLETESMTSSLQEDEYPTGSLNQGRRVDFVLQEAPIESFNDYLFALGSHACYWESEDTVLMILKEIYALMGLAPQRPGVDVASPQMYRSPPSSSLPSPGARMSPPGMGDMPPASVATSMGGAQSGPLAPPPMSGFVRK